MCEPGSVLRFSCVDEGVTAFSVWLVSLLRGVLLFLFAFTFGLLPDPVQNNMLGAFLAVTRVRKVLRERRQL